MGNVNYTPLYDKFPDSKYEIDERWNYDQSGMTPQQINARDREVSREIKGENTHKIHYIKHTYRFKFGECCNCGKKWYEEYQEICEGCGVVLPRL